MAIVVDLDGWPQVYVYTGLEDRLMADLLFPEKQKNLNAIKLMLLTLGVT